VVETEDGDKIGTWAWKPLFFIIGANLVFGLMIGGLPNLKIPAMGLIAGIYALTFIASLAGEEFKLQGSRDSGHRAGDHQLPGLHRAAQVAVSGVADVYYRLRNNNGLFTNLSLGFSVAFTPINLMYAFVGCLLGTLIGVLPGIGPLATIAMLFAGHLRLPPVSALIMLAGIYTVRSTVDRRLPFWSTFPVNHRPW